MAVTANRPIPPQLRVSGADPLDTVAWRAPAADRFRQAPANDWGVGEGQPSAYQDTACQPEPPLELPTRWVVAVGGALGAALLGLMLGGAFAL